MGSQQYPNWAERPLGMKDIYPDEARQKRSLENKLLEFFEAEGFEMVSCGVFEYVDTLLRGRLEEETSNWVQLFDTSGRAMALRPDITPSVARMAAPLIASGQNNIQWCYAERVYRRAQENVPFTWSTMRAAESAQVGVEWLGQDGTDSDVSLLTTAVKALHHLNLHNWQLVVGHAAFTPAYLRATGLSEDDVEDLLLELAEGNYVGFRQKAEDAGVDVDVLNQLSELNPRNGASLPGHIKAAFRRSSAGELALEAWDHLTQLGATIDRLGFGDGISFDLTLCRDLTYYTGIVFEVFAEGAGAPIALGGRYDELLQHFGARAPAIGFTFEIDGLLNVMSHQTFGSTLAKGEEGEC
ncbi:ATP phosphoribosyltransferase regulatory subunit [Alicyclobacillus sp. SO9]|uniref:ATP phosphoribosyltransferase regulatory subunit n=1 Tax=Alicyclobacillus sp. SO9 TaxID=2665646 RepID=UPI0018E81D16|nr:ATP phosphoribosyltransferase regulatory subunit [Alicyclobacillus sp. SO9]QQE80197.1 ATP phosphoribosyltransferase regulatory subunit [Alicyclobacillus sp. SO9]